MTPSPAVRQISGLLRAERCPARPLPRPRTPAQRGGLTYQRKVGKQLASIAARIGAELEADPWFSFIDENGCGQAVPDFILNIDGRTLVIEVKLTYTPNADLQLQNLYVPVIENLYPRPVSSAIICRNLTTEIQFNRIIPRLGDTLVYCLPSVPILPWLGLIPIPW